MDLGINGKSALITASSQGLGYASALALAEEGVRVTINERHEGALRQAETALIDVGATVQAIRADVTQPHVPAELVAAHVDRYGGVDILVANAGGPPPGGPFDVTEEMVDAAINANMLTSMRLVEQAIPFMRATGWGRVCLITSFSIKQPIPDLALSNLARTGLWAWAKTAATKVAGEGITINSALPGSHDTERTRQLGHGGGRNGTARDFGCAVAFLCSEHVAFINGTTLAIDGGATLGLL